MVMCKRTIGLVLFALVLGVVGPAWAATKVIIVTNNPGDEAEYTPFLQNLLGGGVIVEAEDDKYIDPLSASAKADLTSADLIIVSRRTSSGKFVADIPFWNGLAVPMLLHSSFLIGDDRWRWMPGGTQNVDVTQVGVVAPDDLIFDGVTVTDGLVEISSTPLPGLDVSNQGSAGNGAKIATPAGSDNVMIARWAAGTEYYRGSGQIAGGPRVFFGMRTDEFLPFVNENGKKMLGNAILTLLGILRGAPIASEPVPGNGQTDVPRDIALAWAPGDEGTTHDVYLGTVFDDVNDASRAYPLDVLVAQGQEASTYEPAGLLEFGQTYYWRIDEVGPPPQSTVYKGDVWTFVTEPVAYPIENVIAVASSSEVGRGPENTVNSSGLDANDLHSTADGAMWLSDLSGVQPTWIEYEFDKPYRLHEMSVWNHNGAYEKTIGIGAKDVVMEYSEDGVNYLKLGTTHEFARAPGTPGYAPNTTVDFGGVMARYVRLTIQSNWGGIFSQYGLSEVRFLYTPTYARKPDPAPGAADVAVDASLAWRPGREAAQHAVYLGTDEQIVANEIVPVGTATEPVYGPLSLDLGTTYYWRVDEANDLAIPGMWAGNVWSFSTAEDITVDDFESYTDGEGNRIYESWIDGWNDPTNGSVIGYAQAPFAERGVIRSGRQAMPLFYDNTSAASSEAKFVFGTPQDWTQHGIATLVLFFQGKEDNSGGPLYVKIDNTKVVYNGGAADMTEPSWMQWNIDLASTGAALSRVTSLTIGVEGGGSGVVYIDDIRLYGPAPAQPR
jgi:hypothetical protein